MTAEFSEVEVQKSVDVLQGIAHVMRHESGNIPVELNRELTDTELKRYADCFRVLPRFSLSFRESSVTDDALRCLGEARGLEHITIAGCPGITGAGFRYLADLPRLDELYLDGSRVTTEGMAGIGRVKGLRTLWLGLLYVRDEGLWHLRNLHQLERLSLEGGLITDEGLQYIGGMTNMRQLHIDNTKITDAGLKHLARLRQLEWLDLSRDQVTGVGLADLPHLESMRELDLSETQISDDSIDLIARFPNLKRLDVSDTKVTARGIQQLRKMLPKCNIIPKMPTGTRAVDRVFGPLVWAGQEWEGTIEIAALAKYHCRWQISCDSFYQPDDYDPTIEYHDPEVGVTVIDPDGTGPSLAQRRALLLLREHEQRICGDMLRGILANVREYEDAFADDFYGPPGQSEQRTRVFDQLDQPDGMRELLQLGSIIVHRREKDTFAYMTFGFECSWDDEHGMCVLMHKNRVVEISEYGSLYDFDYSSFHPGEGEPLEIVE